MTFAIVGNNDGPLTLLRALSGTGLQPVAVGLQKDVDGALRQDYEQCVASENLLIDFNQRKLIDRLSDYSITWLINCFCNFKFTTLLDCYSVLNVHLAPLPRYRGRHPLPWALINGETTFGVTIHQMTNVIDGGDIYWQRQVPISAGMSVAELRARLMEELEANFGAFLTDFSEGDITPQPNHDRDATYVARRYPADSALTEWYDRDLIVRKVMALRSTANPAVITVDTQAIKVRRATPGQRCYVGVAAPFVSQVEAKRVEVVCQDGQTVWLGVSGTDSSFFQLNQRIYYVYSSH